MLLWNTNNVGLFLFEQLVKCVMIIEFVTNSPTLNQVYENGWDCNCVNHTIVVYKSTEEIPMNQQVVLTIPNL